MANNDNDYRKVKVGVIGTGVMGQHHVRNYANIRQATLVGITDVDHARARDLASQFNTESFEDVDGLLDAGVEAVSIAVPTNLHEEVGSKVIERGVHALIEKPITNTLASARNLIDLADRYGVKLMVGHIERYNPIIPLIKEKVRNSDIISINFTRVGPFPSRISDVGVIIDLAVHDIDLARFITDSEVEDVHSITYSSDGKREDTALITLEMGSGALASINVNWLTPFKIREVMVTTPDLCLKGWLLDQRLAAYSQYEMGGSYIAQDFTIPFAEPLFSELTAFVDCIRKDTPPPITGLDGLRNLEIALMCLEDGRK